MTTSLSAPDTDLLFGYAGSTLLGVARGGNVVTLDLNYLAAAASASAEVRPLHRAQFGRRPTLCCRGRRFSEPAHISW
jgi:hypothetical protein